MKRRYTLSYLPLFEADLDAVWRHIALKLRNPEAAEKLVLHLTGSRLNIRLR